jgi:hypothetical protein
MPPLKQSNPRDPGSLLSPKVAPVQRRVAVSSIRDQLKLLQSSVADTLDYLNFILRTGDNNGIANQLCRHCGRILMLPESQEIPDSSCWHCFVAQHADQAKTKP